jgi:hypothetical protein
MPLILVATALSFCSATLWVFFCSVHAFFHQAFEDLGTFALRLAESAQAGGPDLLRRVAHIGSDLVVEQCGGVEAVGRCRFLRSGPSSAVS